jgi:hypothetical protein
MIQLVNMPAGWLTKKLSFSALKEKSKAHKSLLNKNKNKKKKLLDRCPLTTHQSTHVTHIRTHRQKHKIKVRNKK